MKDHHIAFIFIAVVFAISMYIGCMPPDVESVTVPETATEQSRTIPLL